MILSPGSFFESFIEMQFTYNMTYHLKCIIQYFKVFSESHETFPGSFFFCSHFSFLDQLYREEKCERDVRGSEQPLDQQNLVPTQSIYRV